MDNRLGAIVIDALMIACHRSIEVCHLKDSFAKLSVSLSIDKTSGSCKLLNADH